MSEQVNYGYINQLLSIPKRSWPKPNRKTGHPGVPQHIKEMVEKERQRRFEMIMDISPDMLLNLIRKKQLSWM